MESVGRGEYIVQYKYIDKTAIKRAIKQYPRYKKAYMPKGIVANQAERNGWAIDEILSVRQSERIARELVAVEWMLLEVEKFPYGEEIIRAIQLVIWDNRSMVAACRIMSVSDSTLTRRLRAAYLLVGAQLGLLESVGGSVCKDDGFDQAGGAMLRPRKERGGDWNVRDGGALSN